MKFSTVLLAGTMALTSSYAFAQAAQGSDTANPPVNSNIDRGTVTNNGAQGMTGAQDGMGASARGSSMSKDEPVNSEIDKGTATNNGAQGMTNGMEQGRASTMGNPSAPMNNGNMNTTNPTCDNASTGTPGMANCQVNGGSGPSN